MRTFWTFILALVISFIPGIIGVMFTPFGHSDLWFNALNQSSLTPAPWVFSVAWTVLYALLGVALFFVIRTNTVHPEYKKGAYWLFGIQMVLNALWSYMFFGANLVGVALFVLLALLIASIWMAYVFWGIHRGASVITMIYIAWLIFALYLNSIILLMN